MPVINLILVAGLLTSVGEAAAWSGPGPAPAALPGVWEATNLVTPERVILVLDPGGRYRMLVWEDGDVGPQEVTGRYEVEDGVLELEDPTGGPPEALQLTLDGSVLILGPPPGERGLAVRFERRPWIAPWVGAAPAPYHPGSGE